MKTIGIETSSDVGSVGAAYEGGLSEIVFSEGSSHGRGLAKALRDLLSQVGWKLSEVDLIAVGLGPGSYTGLRIGSAFAKALAFANSIPIVGVSSFEAMAWVALEYPGPIAPLLDARWGQAYWALFSKNGTALDRLSPDTAGTPEEAVAAAPEGTLFFGPGVAKFMQTIGSRGICAPSGPWDRPRADEVARAGLRKFEALGPDDPDLVEPLYLRRTQAEQKAGG